MISKQDFAIYSQFSVKYSSFFLPSFKILINKFDWNSGVGSNCCVLSVVFMDLWDSWVVFGWIWGFFLLKLLDSGLLRRLCQIELNSCFSACIWWDYFWVSKNRRISLILEAMFYVSIMTEFLRGWNGGEIACGSMLAYVRVFICLSFLDSNLIMISIFVWYALMQQFHLLKSTILAQQSMNPTADLMVLTKRVNHSN